MKKEKQGLNTASKIALGLGALGIAATGFTMVSAHDLGDDAGAGMHMMGELPDDAPAYAVAARDALEAGDYEAWKAARQEAFDEMTTEENFNHLKTMHDLIADGKYDEARQYAEDNDLRPPHGPGMRHGFRRGMDSDDTQNTSDDTAATSEN
ncbi:hypothetical protein KC644_03445 [Candidatus Berkelbacteria bacterium]|nr:hypothetical protein [Candidatus Berkelbacteria bacterium]